MRRSPLVLSRSPWLLAACAVLAAACGSDDDEGADGPAMTAAGSGGDSSPSDPTAGRDDDGSSGDAPGGRVEGDDAEGDDDGETPNAGGSAPTPAPNPNPATVTDLGGPCNAVLREQAPNGFIHETNCTPLAYDTNPPSGGTHYANWADFRSYDFAVPAGFLVHSLEHGAVVFWYDCPEGCSDEVAEVEGFLETLPEDPLCAAHATADRRTIVTPYPELDTRWAASAWGATLTADCFDEDVFRDFYEERVGRGREALCIAGIPIEEDACP